MLKKLLKYDLKYIYKVLIVFYVLSIFFAILTRCTLYNKDIAIIKIIGQVCSGITVSMIINIIINNLMRLWARFYNNFYKDESYLTHTLPVSKKTLFLSKFFTEIITLLISMIVIILTILIAYYTRDNYNLLINMVSSKTLIHVVLLFFLEMVLLVISGYFGIIIGQNKNDKKLGISILVAFVLYIINQLLLVLVIFVVGLFNKDILLIFKSSDITDFNIINNLMIIGTVFYTFLIGIYYCLCTYLFNKGVNVE